MLSFLIGKTNCQDTTSKINYAIRYSFYYNYKVAHHSPVFSIEHHKHNLYVGPEYSSIFQPTPIADIIYEPNSIGANLGYRYFFAEPKKKLCFFGQYDFSIFQIKYKEYQLGPPFISKRKKLIVENTLYFGADYKMSNHVHFFAGIPSSFVGIEYNL